MIAKIRGVASGRVVLVEHTSRVLADNPLGDPHERRFPVWLPPQYDSGSARARGRRFPVLFDLVGYTAAGAAHVNWRAFEENVAEKAARLLHEKRMGAVIIVFPDCFTRLGGNQYINSPAIGNYADYLTRELIPFVDREFRTLASREHRGCFGKSSGGYGAILHAMKYAQHWGAVADHSGDCYFDFCYLADWPNTLDELARYRKRPRKPGRVDVRASERGADRGVDDGRVKRFLEAFHAKSKPSSSEIHCLMNLCMAASYDPDPRVPNGFRIPFNLETGELLAERWERWRRHDPIWLVAQHAAALRSLKAIYIDCGWRDQYHLHYGARILSKRLTQHRIAHRYEEFNDNHSGIDYRMDLSLPFLYRALKP
ncbi:MAG TPA: alpha/beta hydrolase-fold protein [Burkholderiaceae bacterium]|nr:alpha/beta hydrolase-fold protein [Burkholderiaceae bacterium]